MFVLVLVIDNGDCFCRKNVKHETLVMCINLPGVEANMLIALIIEILSCPPLTNATENAGKANDGSV